MRGMNSEPQKAEPSSATEPEPLLRNVLRGAFPQISVIMEMGKLVQQIEAQQGESATKEERMANLRTAVDRMLAEHPDNEFLVQMRKTLYDQNSAQERDDQE